MGCKGSAGGLRLPSSVPLSLSTLKSKGSPTPHTHMPQPLKSYPVLCMSRFILYQPHPMLCGVVQALFPIQKSVFQPAQEGRDLIGRAKTGSGKTLAFALPVIESLIEVG